MPVFYGSARAWIGFQALIFDWFAADFADPVCSILDTLQSRLDRVQLPVKLVQDPGVFLQLFKFVGDLIFICGIYLDVAGRGLPATRTLLVLLADTTQFLLKLRLLLQEFLFELLSVSFIHGGAILAYKCLPFKAIQDLGKNSFRTGHDYLFIVDE